MNNLPMTPSGTVRHRTAEDPTMNALDILIKSGYDPEEAEKLVNNPDYDAEQIASDAASEANRTAISRKGRCQALTADEAPCKNAARRSTADYCSVHKDREESNGADSVNVDLENFDL